MDLIQGWLRKSCLRLGNGRGLLVSSMCDVESVDVVVVELFKDELSVSLPVVGEVVEDVVVIDIVVNDVQFESLASPSAERRLNAEADAG